MHHEPWSFGEQPLAETCELSALLRTIAGHAIAMERPSESLRDAIRSLRIVESRMRAELPQSMRPRIGDRDAPERRVYLDHSRGIAHYNPCFPAYELTCADERGEGAVTFPLVYEGPPGFVHGGFVAVLFDCVLQQLGCDLGTTGSTAVLEVHYRRPTPLLTPLRITAARETVGREMRGQAQLWRDDELLCSAVMTAITLDREMLPTVSPRRLS